MVRRFGALGTALLAAVPAAAGVAWLALARAERPASARSPATAAGADAGAAAASDPACTMSTGDAPAPGAAPTLSVPHSKTPNTSRTGKPLGAGEVAGGTPAEAAAGAAAAGTGAATDMPESEILARIQAGEPGFEVLASRLKLGSEPLPAPDLREGEEWLVETFYRQMQAARGDAWSGPALWRFRIEREVSFRDRPCFEFSVARADEPDYPPAVFYVTRDTYRLAGAQAPVTERGKTRAVAIHPDEETLAAPGAVEAPLSIVPFDLPPLGVEARRAPPGLALDRDPDARPPAALLARMPGPEDLAGAGGAHLDVEYRSPHDGTLVRQRWSKTDMRWPVVSRTETTWSFRRRP